MANATVCSHAATMSGTSIAAIVGRTCDDARVQRTAAAGPCAPQRAAIAAISTL